MGDVVQAAVTDGAGVVPTAEDRLNRHLQLLPRVVRKFAPCLLANERLEALDGFLQIVNRQIGVPHFLRLFAQLLGAAGFQFVQNVLKLLSVYAHHDVAKHLHETPIGIVGEPLIVRLLDEPLNCLVIETQVQDGVHHAGHGSGST